MYARTHAFDRKAQAWPQQPHKTRLLQTEQLRVIYFSSRSHNVIAPHVTIGVCGVWGLGFCGWSRAVGGTSRDRPFPRYHRPITAKTNSLIWPSRPMHTL